MFPTTVIHIILIIVSVVENKLVDRLRPIHDLVDQRLTQQILIRPFRTIAHGNTDASDLSLVHVIRPKEKIILTVLVDYRRSPHSDLRPFHLCRIKNRGMLGPIHQISGTHHRRTRHQVHGRAHHIKIITHTNHIGVGHISPDHRILKRYSLHFGLVPFQRHRLAPSRSRKCQGACQRPSPYFILYHHSSSYIY